jgi:urease accessory protein
MANGGRRMTDGGRMKSVTTSLRHGVTAVALLFSCAAQAHHFMDDALPKTFLEGLLSGVGHPLIGPDHAAFIVATGFLLALVDRGMLGVLALIGGTLAGAAMHLMGSDVPGGEIGVALSVILVGVLVMARRKIELPWLAAGLAVAGVLHGHAYAETIFGAEPAPLGAYLIGFSLVQLAVAGAAFWVHRRMITARVAWAKPVAVGLGGVVGVVGIVFLALNI